jgi:hypothetical protein
MSAVEAVLTALDHDVEPDKADLRQAVKELAQALAARHPGRSVEVRVPPYTAVQCVAGPRHTRGTPPNVVEAEPLAWLLVCTGRASWPELVRTGRIRASGERSDLSALLPLT